MIKDKLLYVDDEFVNLQLFKFNFKNDTGLKLRLNINNLGNTVYLAESLTNNFVEPSIKSLCLTS